MTIEAAPLDTVPEVTAPEVVVPAQTEPVAASTNADPIPGSQPVEPIKEEPKPKNHLKERFHELTTQRNQAKADAELLSEILSEYTNTNTPKRADFQSDEEYHTSMANFRETLRSYKSNLQTAETKVQKIDSKIQSEEEASWSTHIEEANIPDYDEKVSKANIPISAEAYSAILSMKKDGPSVVYYLANNPEIAHSLSKMSPSQQLVKLGAIQASISNTVRATATPVINPNTPPSQRASSQGAVSKSLQESTPEERANWPHEKWVKWRNNQKD